jgi:hypothetical protein
VKAALVTAIALPILLVLLVGGAMGSSGPAPSTTPSRPAVTSYPQAMPAAAAPFPSPQAGCIAADPTVAGGCLTPATAWLVGQVEAAFGPLSIGCWDVHTWNPTSDHPHGRACDITFGQLGSYPAAADLQRGWLLAEWLRSNADALDVAYVIWAGRIWSTSRAAEGWRPYTGGGVYDPTDPTGGQHDHVHVSTR